MWLISTLNPRGTILAKCLPFAIVCVPSIPVWAWVHTRAYPFHSETNVTPPKPTETGILAAAIAWGKGLWELGETFTLDCRTLTSHVTSYEIGLFALLPLNTILMQLPRKVCAQKSNSPGHEGHGKGMLYNFDKDGALKMLVMQLL